MSKTIRVQKSHSRNSHDWKRVTLPSGREEFQATGRGVPYRITLLLGLMRKYRSVGKGDMLDALLEVNLSYRVSDLSQPLVQMRKLGMIRVKGDSYSLTSNGLRIWKSINVKWA